MVGCDTLCSTLQVLIKHILNCDDSEMYDVLGKRLRDGDCGDALHTAALLEVDEAKEVLDKGDQAQVEQQNVLYLPANIVENFSATPPSERPSVRPTV